MVERQHYYGRLVFDRDAIVRAALRAYVELRLTRLDPRKRVPFTSSSGAEWEGDVQRGAIYNDDGQGGYEVVAWNEAGVVGLACHLGRATSNVVRVDGNLISIDATEAGICFGDGKVNPDRDLHGISGAGVFDMAGTLRAIVWGGARDPKLVYACPIHHLAALFSELDSKRSE